MMNDLTGNKFTQAQFNNIIRDYSHFVFNLISINDLHQGVYHSTFQSNRCNYICNSEQFKQIIAHRYIQNEANLYPLQPEINNSFENICKIFKEHENKLTDCVYIIINYG